MTNLLRQISSSIVNNKRLEVDNLNIGSISFVDCFVDIHVILPSLFDILVGFLAIDVSVPRGVHFDCAYIMLNKLRIEKIIW